MMESEHNMLAWLGGVVSDPNMMEEYPPWSRPDPHAPSVWRWVQETLMERRGLLSVPR